VDQNQFGIKRESPFKAAPQAQEPYLYFQGNTYVAPVPGNVTAPFLAPGATQAPPAVPTVPTTVINNNIGGWVIPSHNDVFKITTDFDVFS
jgi:hypothetical protein